MLKQCWHNIATSAGSATFGQVQQDSARSGQKLYLLAEGRIERASSATSAVLFCTQKEYQYLGAVALKTIDFSHMITLSYSLIRKRFKLADRDLVYEAKRTPCKPSDSLEVL